MAPYNFLKLKKNKNTQHRGHVCVLRPLSKCVKQHRMYFSTSCDLDDKCRAIVRKMNRAAQEFRTWWEKRTTERALRAKLLTCYEEFGPWILPERWTHNVTLRTNPVPKHNWNLVKTNTLTFFQDSFRLREVKQVNLPLPSPSSRLSSCRRGWSSRGPWPGRERTPGSLHRRCAPLFCWRPRPGGQRSSPGGGGSRKDGTYCQGQTAY